MKQDISHLAKKLGQRGGAQTKKRGRDYYRKIGKLGLAKRYNQTANTERDLFERLTPLAAPVPPMLEEAIGYNGEAHFVSFHWTPGGDEAYYDDRQRAGTGEWQGYLAFVQHPVVKPLLAQYNLGDSDREAQHWLILDRHTRKLYVALVKDARTFLEQQWPKAEPINMTQEEWTALVKKVKNVRLKEPDMKDIYRQFEEQQKLVEALQNWLNKFLPN
jgi:hypothetical protein